MSKSVLISHYFFLSKNKHCRYWTVGKKTNPPLVLLGGYANKGYEDFLSIVTILQENYFIIIPEYPGWGLSSRLEEPLTIRNYARYLHKLFQQLSLKEVVIFGHCFGGLVATEYVYLYPKEVKAVILANTPFLDGLYIKKFYSLMAILAKGSPKMFRPVFFFWRSRVLNVPLDFFVIKTKTFRGKMKRIKNHIINQSFEDEGAVEENWISFIEYEFAKAKKIPQPVHIIHGKRDMLIKFSQTKKFHNLFQNASLDILAKSGHVPLIESPGDLVRVIAKYI